MPLEEIQSFIGVKTAVTKDNFIIPNDGLPCFKDNNGETDCLGKGESEKGRSLNKSFSKDVTKILHSIFEPFDNYFATHVLHQKPFNWNFGL